MNSPLAPFERFQGRRFIVLLVVFAIYTLWYTLVGPFAKIQGLAEGLPLQSKLFYSGEYAVEVLDPLNGAQKRALYTAYILCALYDIAGFGI